MIDHPSHGSPLTAAIALTAAALGACAHALGVDRPGLLAAMPQTPVELVDWVKAGCNSLFIVVNTLVGCYHLLRMGKPMAGVLAGLARPFRRRRRKPAHPKTPAVPRPVEDGAGGDGSAGA